MKQKKTGRILVIIGVVLLSFNFISYLMNKPFIALAILPIGIAFIVIGTILTIHRKRNST